MKLRILISVLVLFVLLTSCTNQSQEQNNNLEEVKRLAGENIKLRQEQSELKAKVEKLETNITTAEENLRFARMTQEELLIEISKEKFEMIQKIKDAPLKTLFGYSFFEFKGSNSIEFGHIIYEKIEDNGIDHFINELSSKGINIIDNVTKSLCEYIKKNELKEQFKTTINDLEKSDSNNKEYIVLRIKMLLQE